MKQGVAVVAYDCHALRLLKSCSIDGSYGFMGMTRKEQVVRLENADEIHANLPLTAGALVAKLGGDLTRGSTLDVALIIVGKRRSTWRHATAGDLQARRLRRRDALRSRRDGRRIHDADRRARAGPLGGRALRRWRWRRGGQREAGAQHRRNARRVRGNRRCRRGARSMRRARTARAHRGERLLGIRRSGAHRRRRVPGRHGALREQVHDGGARSSMPLW